MQISVIKLLIRSAQVGLRPWRSQLQTSGGCRKMWGSRSDKAHPDPNFKKIQIPYTFARVLISGSFVIVPLYYHESRSVKHTII